MAELLYPDHDYYVNNAALAFYSDLVTVPVGMGALIALRLSGGAALVGNFAPTEAAIPSQGVADATLRLLLNATDIQSAGDSGGLLCMQSQRDMTTGGNAYGLLWRPDDANSGFGLALVKVVGGLESGISAIVGINSPGGLKALQLRWTVAEDMLSVALIASISTSLTFGGMEPVLSYTDTVDPLVTTVSEGGCALALSGEDYRMTFDQMSLILPQ